MFVNKDADSGRGVIVMFVDLRIKAKTDLRYI